MKADKMIFLASQKKTPQQTNPQEEDIFDITIGQIIQMLKLPDNTIKVFVEGNGCRVAIRRFIESDQCFQVEVQPVGDEIREREIEIKALIRSLKAVFETYLAHNKKIPQEICFPPFAP